jgi:hypothetical protein
LQRADRIAAVLAAALLGVPAAAQTVQERLGHPPDARLLVIHADDLGMSRSVNRATFEALERGWVTSASILVPCAWFPDVARWARQHPEADLGIHLTLNSEWTGLRWGPISDGVPSLLDADGYLPLTAEAVVERATPAEVELELRAQVERARTAGIRLTHLDSHMGTLFRTEELARVYRRLGEVYGLPRLVERATDGIPDVRALVDRVLGISPGVEPADWQRAYRDLLAPLPPGVYELIVHLAYDDEEMRGATWDHPDWGAAWRQSDRDLVSDPAFRSFLEEQRFVLVGWGELARALPGGAAGP